MMVCKYDAETGEQLLEEVLDETPLAGPNPSEIVEALKLELQATDYQIIKYSEYQLLGLEPPYDISALHTERQALRDQINQLEEGGE